MIPWLLLVGSLELAWFPWSAVESYSPPSIEAVLLDLGVKMTSEVRAGGPKVYAFVGGDLLVLVAVSRTPRVTSMGYGIPTTLYSVIRTGVHFGPLEIGAEHSCTHPVVPHNPHPSILWEGGFDKVYIRFSTGKE